MANGRSTVCHNYPKRLIAGKRSQAFFYFMKMKSIPKAKPKDNGKHPGGRPPTYTPEYLSRLAQDMVVWFKKKNNWWLKDFAIKKGFSAVRFSEFAITSKEFSEAYLLCKDIQESKLVHIGFKPYKDRFATFLLKNVAGMRDNQTLQLDEVQFEVLIGKKNDQNKHS